MEWLKILLFVVIAWFVITFVRGMFEGTQSQRKPQRKRTPKRRQLEVNDYIEVETRHYKTPRGTEELPSDGGDYYKQATALKGKGNLEKALETIKLGIGTDESKGSIAFNGREKFISYALLAKKNNDAWAMIQDTIHLLHSQDNPSKYVGLVGFYRLKCKLLLKEKRFEELLSASAYTEQYNYLAYKEWGEHLFKKALEHYEYGKNRGDKVAKPTREKACLRWNIENYPRPTEYPPEYLIKALRGLGMENHLAEFAKVIEKNVDTNPLAMEAALAKLMD